MSTTGFGECGCQVYREIKSVVNVHVTVGESMSVTEREREKK